MKPFDQMDALQRVAGLDASRRVRHALARRVEAATPAPGAGWPAVRTRGASDAGADAYRRLGVRWVARLPSPDREVRSRPDRGRDRSAVPAAAAGLVDYGALDRRDRRIAVVHAAANTLSLACQIVALRNRLSGRLRRGQWIGFAGTLTLSVGGMLGGHLAHKLPGDPATAGADKHV